MSVNYGSQSDVGYFTRSAAGVTEFGSDHPVSVDAARMARENIYHLYDESTQVVCNLIGLSSTNAIQKQPATNTAWKLITSVPFPITFRVDGMPSTLAYILAIEDGDIDCTFNIVELNRPFIREDAEAIVHSEASNTFGSGVSEIISGHVSFEFTAAANRAIVSRLDDRSLRRDQTYEDSGHTKPASVRTYWWRADVWMKSESDNNRLYELYVRQFMPIAEPA